MSTNPANYCLNHTMLRVKDPKASLHFYTEILGMKMIHKMDNENGKFTLYFLAYTDTVPSDEGAARRAAFSQSGVIELTHNWGTESDESFKGYHNGNSDPRGFGHIAITVDDIEAACARFDSLGARWQKRLTDGNMKNIAFLLDPDGYWIEVLQSGFPSQ
ncbi:lactoylglutathione lyase [Syncephalis plumigaleata]|nr:lactoylglutathione lyase [Syncephalis plumigaleata]